MSTTSRNLALRLNEVRTARLNAFERKTGVNGTTLGLECLDAALDYYEAHGPLTFPLIVIPKSSASKIAGSLIMEDPRKYGATISEQDALKKQGEKIGLPRKR
jgi:hypothetical protein